MPDFGRVEPGQGARAFWPGEVLGLRGVLAVGVTRPGRGGWWLTPVYPDHIRHAARQMHGWPMIVSHHLDNTCEFERIATLLDLGAGYPLDTSPRRKRGGPTPLHDYLEPLVWKLHVLKIILTDTEEKRGGEDFSSRIKYTWWSPPEPSPPDEILAILRNVPSIPPFSKASAAEWSKRVIVPYISATDGVDPANSPVPFIRNIWAHRSVKSAATFESHLHSAITGFLIRYGRPG